MKRIYLLLLLTCFGKMAFSQTMYTVPTVCSGVIISATGGSGGTGGQGGSVGGYGGSVICTLNVVTPIVITSLSYYQGTAGATGNSSDLANVAAPGGTGYGTGGASGVFSAANGQNASGGGGGGSSAVFNGGTLLLVAGGGGGGGAYTPAGIGGNGGPNGSNGGNNSDLSADGGIGGTSGSFGAAGGTGSFAGGIAAGAAAPGNGGQGAEGPTRGQSGGGGGAGYGGGGGGGTSSNFLIPSGGGGGGANYIASISGLTNGTNGASGALGDGSVTFSPYPTAPSTPNGTTICGIGNTIPFMDAVAGGTWSTSNTSIASISASSGSINVIGLSVGSASITYTVPGSFYYYVTVTVKALPAAITGNTQMCTSGATITLSDATAGGTWSSSNTTVANVNSNTGVVTPEGVQGLATITYSNGCAVVEVVTVNALPTIYTFTGGGAYCANDLGVPVGLTLSDTGISYQLYLGSTPVGTAVAGTGSAISFGIQSTIGVYHAIATNTVTTCTSDLSGITISINPLPDTFTVTGGGSYCANGSGMHVGLDNSATGINYQLYNGSVSVGSAMAGTGSALDFGLQTAAGSYTVTATNATTLCPQGMAGSVTITVIPLPTIDTVTGGGSYCSGDTGVYVTLNNSTAATIYQLYRGGSPVGHPDTSTGGALNFGLQTAGGQYTVIATNPVTTCVAAMTGTVTVTVNPLPHIHNVTGGGSYCAGGAGVHVGLSGSYFTIRYQLYNGSVAAGSPKLGTGSALDFGLITAAGTYTVSATDTNTGCMRNMNDSAIVSITPIVTPHLQIGTNDNAGDTVCGGFPIIFTAHTRFGGATPGYQWNVDNLNRGTSDSTYTYTPTAGDVVAVTMISSAACAIPDTLYDTMKINVEIPEPPSIFIVVSPITTIQIGQPDTLTAVATNCGSSPHYQWFLNGIIVPGATNAVYTSNTFANGDSVTCMVITSGACGGQRTYNSVVISVYPAGVAQVNAVNDIKLMPNPNKGSFTINGTLGIQTDEDVSLEVTDMLGQVIYKNKITAQSGVINERIQLSNTLATGMYILSLKSANETNVFRFVVEQ